MLALGKQQLVNRLRASARFINRISGIVLVLAGAWIVWFWGTALRSGASALGGAAGFEFVEYSDLHFRADDELEYEVGRRSVSGNTDRFTFLFRKP